jgi:hypothetical protein
MAETSSERDDRPTHWWQTVPGALTALAAVITAVTGLIIALKPFSAAPDVIPAPVHQEDPSRPSSPAAAGSRTSSGTPASSVSPVTLALPSPAEVKLVGGNAVLRILSMRLDPYNTEDRALTIHLRYYNNRGYSANFWADSFRLLIADVPNAPINNLNELVPSNGAKEGDVTFQVPAGTPTAVLRILMEGEHTDIPISLSAARSPSPAG